MNLKQCPFCGSTPYLKIGYQGMNFIICGTYVEETKNIIHGCGAIFSFQPDLRGAQLIGAFNNRKNEE